MVGLLSRSPEILLMLFAENKPQPSNSYQIFGFFGIILMVILFLLFASAITRQDDHHVRENAREVISNLSSELHERWNIPTYVIPAVVAICLGLFFYWILKIAHFV